MLGFLWQEKMSCIRNTQSAFVPLLDRSIIKYRTNFSVKANVSFGHLSSVINEGFLNQKGKVCPILTQVFCLRCSELLTVQRSQMSGQLPMVVEITQSRKDIPQCNTLIHTQTHMYTRIHTPMHTATHTHTATQPHTHTHTHTHMHACTHLRTHAHTLTQVWWQSVEL